MPYMTFSTSQTLSLLLSLFISLSLLAETQDLSMSSGKWRSDYLDENPFGIFVNSGSSPPRMEKEVGQKDQQKRSRKKTGTSGNGGDCGGDESDGHDQIHIWTERERRKKMRNMFSNLHALLPDLPLKADKSTIVDEAVKYIKTLEQTLQAVEKKKLEKLKHPSNCDISSNSTSLIEEPESREAFMSKQGSLMAGNFSPQPFGFRPFFPASFQTWFSPNVVMNICCDDAHISICSLKKTGTLAAIFYILEKHQLDVVSSQIYSDHHRHLLMIHARPGGSDEFAGIISAEEVFKLAVGEMNLWLLSC